MRRALAGLVAVFAATHVLLAQQTPQTATFRSGVELVALDVQVVGRDGDPIQGLAADDFRVSIDGKPRRVVSVDMIQYPIAASVSAALASVLDSRPAHLPDVRGRMFILAIDDASFSTQSAGAAFDAAKRFVERLPPEDVVGLFAYPLGPGKLDLHHDHAAVSRAISQLVGLKDPFLGDFHLTVSEIADITSFDSDTVRRVMARECQSGDLSCAPRLRAEAASLAGMLEMRATQSLASLRYLLDNIKNLPYRKTVVLVSGGLVTTDRSGGRPDVGLLIRTIGEEAAAHNMNLYVLHMDTSLAEATNATAPRTDEQSLFRDVEAWARGLDLIAGVAGGSLIRSQAGTGDLAFDRVLKETTAYYLLGVAPEDPDRDGKLHFIKAGVTTRGATVRSRTKLVIPKKGL